MKAIDSIKNLYKRVPAMCWLWIGCGFIILSIALQAATLFLQSYQSLTFVLNLVGYITAAISVPLTILQAYKSAREQAKTDLFLFSQTRLGEQQANLRKAPDSMPTTESQVIHRKP